jgi:PiT family inorganic phosphate transporter
MVLVLIGLVGVLLAYANGANENFKGVATLFGSGTAGYGRSLAWATLTTALVLARGLLTAFSGRGLVPAPVVADPVFSAAVALAGAAHPVLRALRHALGVIQETCVCIGEDVVGVVPGAPGREQALQAVRLPTLAVDAEPTCEVRYQGAVFGVRARRVLDVAHYLSAGAVSFARGLNDTPKIAALLLVGSMLSPILTIVGVCAAMAVAETMAHRVTEMNTGQGFAANAATAFLVIGHRD